jgi:hypothetical protein
MNDELYIDDDGHFQMPSEELASFTAYLRENGLPCDKEESRTFVAEGQSYSFGCLRHPYDIDAAQELYRTWRRGAGV